MSNSIVMAKGFNREEALKEMRQYRNIIELLQGLPLKSIQNIADKHGVSTQALYDAWEAKYGIKWADGLDIQIRTYDAHNLPLNK